MAIHNTLLLLKQLNLVNFYNEIVISTQCYTSSAYLVMLFGCQRTERQPCITYILGMQEILYPIPVRWKTSLQNGHIQ